MYTPEEEKQYIEAMDNYHAELKSKWNKAKEELQGLIHPKYFDFAESNDTYYSEGIVEIIETEQKRSGYSDKKHCRIKEDKDKLLYIFHTDSLETIEESEYEGENIEYYVWQQTGYMGDDYSGYLLLPLLDGKRFWKVGYSC